MQIFFVSNGSLCVVGFFFLLNPGTLARTSSIILDKMIMVDVLVSFLIDLFIYLFLAALGLRCCAQAFSSCGERGLLFVAVCGLLIAVASLIVEHGL